MKKDELIQQILALEWPMFQQVRNRHGRAACQDDERTFTIMRLSQFAAWDEATLTSYHQDLLATKKDGRNIMTEKYGYMMAWTHADEFQLIQADLPAVSMEKRQLVHQILHQQIHWMTETAIAYPNIVRKGRPIRQTQAAPDETSFETYTAGELMTYSLPTLYSLWAHMQNLKKSGPQSEPGNPGTHSGPLRLFFIRRFMRYPVLFAVCRRRGCDVTPKS